MSLGLRLDVVSDIACPWCAVGLASLDIALARLAAEGIAAERHCQPFELNPGMAPEGQEASDYLKAKYGLSDAQLAENRARLHERGAAVGFHFGERSRVWNTLNAHRLLAWAGEQHPALQWPLKRALLQAYHGDGLNPGDPAVLLQAARRAGLDEAACTAAAAVIADPQAFADAVREAQAEWQQAGIRAVPAVVVNQRHLISGGQPSEVFEQALRQIAAGRP